MKLHMDQRATVGAVRISLTGAMRVQAPGAAGLGVERVPCSDILHSVECGGGYSSSVGIHAENTLPSNAEMRKILRLINASGDLMGYRLGVCELGQRVSEFAEDYERANPGCLAKAKLLQKLLYSQPRSLRSFYDAVCDSNGRSRYDSGVEPVIKYVGHLRDLSSLRKVVLADDITADAEFPPDPRYQSWLRSDQLMAVIGTVTVTGESRRSCDGAQDPSRTTASAADDLESAKARIVQPASPTCFNCQEVGHKAAQCPLPHRTVVRPGETSAARRSGDGERGRGTRMTRPPESRDRGAKQLRAGEIDWVIQHRARTAMPAPPPGRQGPWEERGACFRCHKDGHRAAACPTRVRGGAQPPGACFHCHQPGHGVSECPARYRPSRSGLGGMMPLPSVSDTDGSPRTVSTPAAHPEVSLTPYTPRAD